MKILKWLLNSLFSPLRTFQEPERKAHGRLETRHIETLPVAAAGDVATDGFTSIQQIARITRTRQLKKKGVWQPPTTDIAWVVTSLCATEATPEQILRYNRNHWGIENKLHRTKDVILGEDSLTARTNNAPRNLFSLNNLALLLLSATGKPPKQAIEYFQINLDHAIIMVKSLL